MKAPRTRRCAIKTCRKPFTPMSMTHKACSPECAIEVATAARGKKETQERRLQARREAEEKRSHKEKVEYSKKLQWHLERAQTAINAYIKARDFGKSCGCCGRPLDWYLNKDIDCGHFRTVAAAGHLRYNEDNASAQSVYCNRNKAGNQAEYRQHLIMRIGQERVEALENNNQTKNWTREELYEITMTYRAKLKELKARDNP
jgi:hypothetical protein